MLVEIFSHFVELSAVPYSSELSSLPLAAWSILKCIAMVVHGSQTWLVAVWKDGIWGGIIWVLFLIYL